MRTKPLSRLAAFAAAALLAAGCAASPRSAAPAATEPPPPAAQPAAPPAEPAQAASTYPAPQPAQAASTYPAPQPAQAAVPRIGYSVVSEHPHDPRAFTQGLVYIGDDSFYEGTGLEGQSTLREVALDGTVRRSVPIDPAHFGEGVAVVGERIFQLTWQECLGYIYDRTTFAQVKTFKMPLDPRKAGQTEPGACVEGWGLTYDGSRLILSDGSDRLFFVDPAATEQSGQLAVTGQVSVLDGASPVYNLNELEFIKGEVYANIWQTEAIARIDPATGRVTAYLDLTGLRAGLPLEPNAPPPDVLNGIAYDAAGDRLFVTGKLWPRLYEIDLVDELAWRVFLPVADKA